MPLTDPIADMLTRIRNAGAIQHKTVLIPHSKIKLLLLQLMREEGFISGFTAVEEDGQQMLKVELRYYSDNDPAIHGLKRVSKPGLRTYVGKDQIPNYFQGLGMAFLSTSKGIMTGTQARRQNVGGELLFYLW